MTPTPQPRRAAKLPAGMVAIVLLAVLLAFYLYQVGWIQQALAGMQTPIVDSKGIVQVFFTTPTLVYPDQQWQRPASPLLQAVLADIDAACSTPASTYASIGASRSCTTSSWSSTVQ